MSKKVLITGILGQDGANMAEYLLETTDNLIYGMQRRSGSPVAAGPIAAAQRGPEGR